MGSGLTKEHLVRGGAVRVPDRSGLGVELDLAGAEKAHRRYRVAGRKERDT